MKSWRNSRVRRRWPSLLAAQGLEGFKPTPIQGRTSIFEPLGQMAKVAASTYLTKQTDDDAAAGAHRA
jgi:hypothetical protein